MTRSWLFVVLATLSCGGVVGADIAEEKGGHDAGRTPVADAGTVVAQPEPDAGVESPTLDAGETPAPGADAGRPPQRDAGAPRDAGTTRDAGPPRDAGGPFDGGPVFSDPDAGASTATSFELTSSVSGTELPFTVGLGFRRGDVPTSFALDLAQGQVEVKRRWSDGSVKHAIVSGRTDLVANQAKVIRIVSGAFPAGTALTCADVKAAVPSLTVSLGTQGSVSLASVLTNPIRTWLSGSEAVECHYLASVGSGDLRVFFHVRLYRGGRMLVRTVVENGLLTSASDVTYTPTLTLDGTVIYSHGGTALSHPAHTRWLIDAWVGGDPKISARHDTDALMRTRLVPNYWAIGATDASLNAPTRTYAPMQQGDWTQNMGETGFQAQIGLLPSWEARYLTSHADPRALQAVFSNAKSLNSYGLVWRDPLDSLPVQPTKRPTWSPDGEGQGGANGVGAGAVIWELAHHPSGGYLAYLLTGDFFYLETMQLQSATIYLVNGYGHGSGVNRLLSGQTRAAAWAIRTIGQLTGIAPLDGLARDYQALLGATIASWDADRASIASKGIGLFYAYELGNSGYGVPGVIAPWQQNFWAQSMGHVSDLEPLDDMTVFNRVRDGLYRFPVGMLGDSTGYCFTKASQYTVKVGTGTELSSLFDTWGQAYQSAFGTAPCGNTLEGDSGGAPGLPTGYYANLLPAIAYAVDHHAPGAAAAWARLTGATNWSSFATSGFEDEPVWAVVPRRE